MPIKMEMPIHTHRLWSQLLATVCSVLFVSYGASSDLARDPARSGQQSDASTQQPKIPNDQLDSLVAPIALYPDPLLAQVLAASTYPIEIVQLQQWLEKNKGLKDQALQDAVKKQDWDASVQALAAMPDVAKRLADDIKWTTDLGNAFLAQQSDVMDAVQRMRSKAKESGNLKSGEQQKVETKVVENKSVIVIEQSNPQVVYVPSYNPTVVYGPPVYPYPPITYPPPGYYAAGMAISFGVGMAMGAAWGGGWGWGASWGGNNEITINNNNSYNSNRNVSSNRQNVNAGNRTGSNNWQHNPQHRGGAPYSNRATANQYGGTTRGDSLSTRQNNARQNQAQGTARQQNSNFSDRASGSSGNLGANRANAGTGGGNVGANRAAGSGNAGAGGDRIGNRSVSSGTTSNSRGGGAFGGGSGGMSGSSARASGSRGASSMGGGRGGGRRR